MLALIDANFDGVVSYREFLFFLTLLGSTVPKRNTLAMKLGTNIFSLTRSRWDVHP